MKKITFINHASVLIQDGKSFILTDPWYNKAAFGSWLPTPPSIYNPTYLLSLARSSDNFYIIISHGHDDHVDDKLLSLFAPHAHCIIPKYRSPGLKNRLQKCGFKDISEVNRLGKKIDKFYFKSYIFEDISLDDSLLTIYGDDYGIVHANDNWQIMSHDILNEMKSDMSNFKKERRLYMSQTNLADGFPSIYKNYSVEQKKAIINNRQERIILGGIKNAVAIDSGAFLSYAGMALPFINNKEHLLTKSNIYVKSIDEIKKLAKDHNLEDIVLQMSPGDSYDFCKIQKPLGINLKHQDIKKSCIEFYRHYDWLKNCDTYDKNHNKPNKKFKEKLLHIFLDNFKNFVNNKLKKMPQFLPDVKKINFSFQDSDVSSTCLMTKQPVAFVTFNFQNEILEKILLGESNWENSYVGYQSSVLVEPDININPLVRWLSMFGYVYQNRIINDYR